MSSGDQVSLQQLRFKPACLCCRYDLSASPDGACPECGAQFTHLELRNRWLSLEAPDSEEALLRAFKPVCRTCKYDLVATPDGVCPECGSAFTLAGLRSQWIESHRGRPIPLSVFLGIGTAVCLMIWGAVVNDNRPSGIAVLIAGLLLATISAVWTFTVRDRLLRQSPALLLASFFVALLAGSMCYRHIFWAGALIPLPWVVGVTLAWWIGGRVRPAIPWIMVAQCALTPGVLATWGGMAAVMRGHHWSEVDDWLLPGMRSSLPPTAVQEMWIGLAYLAVGSAIGAVGVRRWKRVRAADSQVTPSPSPSPSSSPYPPG